MNKIQKNRNKRKQERGITLVALVITIIIIIILATVTINMAFGDNGLIKQAQLAKDLSANSTVAEGEGMNSLLDEFGNLIGEEGSGTGGEEDGGDTGDDSTIEDLENTINDLNDTIDDLNQQLADEKDKVANLEEEKANLEQQIQEGQTTIEEQQGEIDDLNGQISDKNETISNLESTISSLEDQVSSLNTQVANLQRRQATGTATASQVLTGYTFSNSSSVGLSGSMANRGTLNWSGSNTTYSVPAGYYSGGTLDSRPSYTNGYNAGVSAADNRVNTGSASYTSGYNAGVNAGRETYGMKTKTGTITTPADSSVTITCDFTPDAIVAYSNRSNVGGMFASRRNFHTIMNAGSNTYLDGSMDYITFSGNNVIITVGHEALEGRSWTYTIYGT